MARTMLAVVTHGPRDYRLEQVPVPDPAAGELVIEVGTVGICASDVACWLGGEHFWGVDGSGGVVEPPVIAGHEFSGRVAALGAGAARKWGVREGDRVAAEQIVPCNNCRFCALGHYWMCQRHWIFGFSQQTPGGMARYARVPEQALLHTVPESLTEGEAASIEPLACAWHAVERGDIHEGDSVVVGGAGFLGLCILQLAKLRRPGQLIALDTKPARLELARRLGADVTINVVTEEAVAIVEELTGGYGCDIYFEATGHPAGVVQGMQMIRKLGTFVEVSLFSEPTMLDWTVIGDTKELTIHGSHLGPGGYAPAIAVLAHGDVDVRSLLAPAHVLSDFDTAMREAVRGDVLKPLILPE